MNRPLSVSLILSAAVLSVSGCSESSAPPTAPRSFQLVSYGGELLPVTLRRIVETPTTPGGASTTCDDKLIAATFRLLPTREFTQTDSHLLVCEDGRPDAPSAAEIRGTYTQVADSIELDADFGNGTYYRANARITDGGLTIYRREVGLVGGASSTDPTQLVFRNAAN